MAIDTTIFAADLPPGTYAIGDIIPLVNVDGPANVRSGRGTAILKNILCGATGNNVVVQIHIKNSDWVDEVSTIAAMVQSSVAVLDEESAANQNGHNVNLTQNSGWQVYAEVIKGATTTAGMSVFTLIDVDYPQVSAVTSPSDAVGYPVSISYRKNVTANIYGTMTTANWSVESVDYFKAGQSYVLDAVENFTAGSSLLMFVAFSNAAGMGGLSRIIPVTDDPASIRKKIRYSSVLTKGPMDIKVKVFSTSASNVSLNMVHDYVKKAQ